jgi:hypothetical protein
VTGECAAGESAAGKADSASLRVELAELRAALEAHRARADKAETLLKQARVAPSESRPVHL